ncbi:MAG: lipopolysaccharide biosynthesis protein [Thiobacillus sp.]|nr:lipopolysaccharide biosynthesis protein [Thiobacillus sp.]
MSPPQTQELVHKIISGARWVAALRLTAQTLSWVSTIIVVRFISPGDYGLNSMLEAPMELMMLISTLGLDVALVQSKKLDHAQLRSAFGWLLAINFLLFLTYFFGGAMLAQYFNEPRLDLLAKVLSVVFLLAPFRAIPNALLDRDLQFKAKAIVELVAVVVGAATTLGLAIYGVGVWALVIGLIVNRIMTSILLMIMHPWIVRPTLGPEAAQMIALGGVVALAGAILMLSNSLVSLIAGPTLGAHLLGIYAVAMQFALLPLSKFMPVINPIIFPAFSRLQGHPEEAGYYLDRALSFASIFLFPVMIGLACVAPSFVLVVLGEKWSEAILPLALISLAMPFRMITNFVRPVMNGMGRADLNLKSSFLALALLLPSIPIAMTYGVLGLAILWLIVEPVLTLATAKMGQKAVTVSLLQMARNLLPALISSAIMAAAVFLFRHYAGIMIGLPALLMEVAVGALAYVMSLWIFFRPQLLNATHLLLARKSAT